MLSSRRFKPRSGGRMQPSRMIETIANIKRSNKNTIAIGVLLLASGPTLNYLFERYNILAVRENSPYPVALSDGLYPVLCVFLSLIGIVLIVGGALGRTTTRRLLRYAYMIAVPLTIPYALFSFGMQFMQTGFDRLGECPGFVQAASSSNVIPESKREPGQRAAGCGTERRGIYLSYYNDIVVYGVTDEAAQQHVLDAVAEHFRQAHTHPVQVRFYEEENWSVRHVKKGVTVGSGTPSKLVRVVNIG
jgi:hypothetical protein